MGARIILSETILIVQACSNVVVMFAITSGLGKMDKFAIENGILRVLCQRLISANVHIDLKPHGLEVDSQPNSASARIVKHIFCDYDSGDIVINMRVLDPSMPSWKAGLYTGAADNRFSLADPSVLSKIEEFVANNDCGTS